MGACALRSPPALPGPLRPRGQRGGQASAIATRSISIKKSGWDRRGRQPIGRLVSAAPDATKQQFVFRRVIDGIGQLLIVSRLAWHRHEPIIPEAPHGHLKTRRLERGGIILRRAILHRRIGAFADHTTKRWPERTIRMTACHRVIDASRRRATCMPAAWAARSGSR